MAELCWYNVVIINTIRLIMHDHCISCVYDLNIYISQKVRPPLSRGHNMVYKALMRNVFKSENLAVED